MCDFVYLYYVCGTLGKSAGEGPKYLSTFGFAICIVAYTVLFPFFRYKLKYPIDKKM